jgi:phosphoribosyl 1,2-cyclic phosphodiesterase
VRLASLGSGSRGNATLVAGGDCCLLIDCGFSVAEVERRATALGLDPATLTAVLVTHEHSDHASGVAALSRRYRLPVYLTHGCLASGRLDGAWDLRPFNADSVLDFGDVAVRAVSVPHDAREPVQYVVQGDGVRIGVLTDLGHATPHVCTAFRGCDLLLLEFNHDRRMLEEGPYPPKLKRRVGGPWGHLSNEQAADLLAQLDPDALQHLCVAHVSEKNNRRACVESLIAERFPQLSARVVWACQERGFAWVQARRGEPAMPSALAPTESAGAY